MGVINIRGRSSVGVVTKVIVVAPIGGEAMNGQSIVGDLLSVVGVKNTQVWAVTFARLHRHLQIN